MDPRKNPFAPGAGTQPPELAGRDTILERSEIALDRIRSGLAARSFIFYGLRGVGKTVLLNRIRTESEARGFATLFIEAPEDRSLPAMLAPHLRALLQRLSRSAKIKHELDRAMRVLAGFIRALKVKFSDIEVAIDLPAEFGVADSGDLEHDLTELLQVVGEAAKATDNAVVLFIDELQYISEQGLAALITAMHNVSQRRLPLVMIATGLPNLLGQMGKAKSYAERLFEFVPIGPLDATAAKDAIRKPVNDHGARITAEALDQIIFDTQGFAYFLQEWGKHAWNLALTGEIGIEDANNAKLEALYELDASFFRVRFDRLTPKEKQYLSAMAALGEGSHRSGEIARRLGKPVSQFGPVRASLQVKGMIYSPSHGETVFTVPLFEGFLMRNIPVAE